MEGVTDVSERNPYRIFPSHGWVKDDDYLRLFEYLESTTNFFYSNVCDPDESPESETVAQRRTRILAAMKSAEVLVVMSGAYEAYREWIDFEIQAAGAHDVPIVLVEPFGPHDAPEALKEKAEQIVGWNSRTIEDAIRMAARHDDTKRFDMIEFDLS
jgi:hypothetical protein